MEEEKNFDEFIVHKSGQKSGQVLAGYKAGYAGGKEKILGFGLARIRPG